MIKEGRLPESEVWRGTCHNCKSVVEATRGELTIHHDPSGRDGPHGTAQCPLIGCNATINFYPKRDQ